MFDEKTMETIKEQINSAISAIEPFLLIINRLDISLKKFDLIVTRTPKGMIRADFRPKDYNQTDTDPK